MREMAAQVGDQPRPIFQPHSIPLIQRPIPTGERGYH